MSGAELLGIISGIITLVDATIKISNAAQDASGLPPSFRDIASRLPLIQESLSLASSGLEEDNQSAESCAALRPVLEACAGRAEALRDIFQAVIPPAGTPRMARYLRAVKTMPKADRIESLMEGITRDLQVIMVNHSVKTATRAQIEELVREIRGKGDDTYSPINFYNVGPGKQYVYEGTGNQNIATGQATQINGPIENTVFNLTVR